MRMAVDIANGMSKAAAGRKYGVSTRTVFRILKDDYPPKREPAPCGTIAAYRRHQRQGERCWKCAEANAAYQKEWKKRQKEKANGQTRP